MAYKVEKSSRHLSPIPPTTLDSGPSRIPSGASSKVMLISITDSVSIMFKALGLYVTQELAQGFLVP